MRLSNELIYTYASNLSQQFTDQTQILPIKINFYLQKNKNELLNLAKDIEVARENIIRAYGIDLGNGEFNIPVENQETATREFEELLALEQDVKIYKVKLSAFTDDLNLTLGQMDALMFMIDDEE